MADKVTPDMSDDQVIAILDTLDPNDPYAAREVFKEASPRQMFVVSMPLAMGKRPDVVEAAKSLEGSVKWVIEGEGGGSFLMSFGAHGIKIEESEGNATTTVTFDMETWQGIVSGDTNPVEAFMNGKVMVLGGISQLMALQGVLGHFIGM